MVKTKNPRFLWECHLLPEGEGVIPSHLLVTRLQPRAPTEQWLLLRLTCSSAKHDGRIHILSLNPPHPSLSFLVLEQVRGTCIINTARKCTFF